MTSTGKHWSRRKEARPEEIRAAAAAEFSEKGFESVTVASIAERAGVAKGTIYLYYRSKQALFAALADEISGSPGPEVADQVQTPTA